jgi:hypothetical protein
MKIKLLLSIPILLLSLTIHAKKTPVYTIIKNAKKIVVVQDFMQADMTLGASFVTQNYEGNPAEKLPVPQSFVDLNSFIGDYLNSKFEVSTFQVAPDSIYYSKAKLFGQEIDKLDFSKIDADLVVRVNYEIDYRGWGQVPEIPYEVSIRIKLSFYEPRGDKTPKKRKSVQIAYLRKSIGNLEDIPRNTDDPLLDADYFIENHNPSQFIEELKPMMIEGIDKQYLKFVDKAK